MNVSVQNKDGKPVWEYGVVNGQNSGMTSTRFRTDGTLQKVIDALNIALFQAKGELSLLPDESD